MQYLSTERANIDELKQKIRKLKRCEIKIRFSDEPVQKAPLIWDAFFDLHENPSRNAKYTLHMLATMNREDYRNIIDDYFVEIYCSIYNEYRSTITKIFDPIALARTNLPSDADAKEIKRRFRELAKETHPDTGGDALKFLELMKVYRKLMDD
jgi:DnaJ-class molecular chaperone with C-terminal Zn finger domain